MVAASSCLQPLEQAALHVDAVLTDALGRSGLDDLIIRQRGRIAIAADSARLDCDYYDWIRKRENAAPFLGEYMEQYSWAEVTKANLERAYVASLG